MKDYIVSGLVGLTCAFIILFGWLWFLDLAFINDNNKVILSAAIGLIGAIIGGTVSGILTLLGVRMSIKGAFDGIQKSIDHQEHMNFRDNIGFKLNKLYSVKNIIYTLDRMLSNRVHGWNEQIQPDSAENIDFAIWEYILPKHNLLLELSSAVDWEFYFEIKSFVDQSRKLTLTLESTDLNKLADITDKLTLAIEEKHEKRLTDKFKEASIQ